ncbi:MAG: hypothetical protein ACTTI6_07380 [Treponema sp.]|uniref:hypothetical protein n=1 Tax=Treponema sp. TaxID=166 RepID=UPI003FA1BEAB
MIAIQNEQLIIGYETGLIETNLSNGWIVKQRFDWYVDYDGLQIDYTPDAMEVSGDEQREEYSDEELSILKTCEWDISDLEAEILSSREYEEAETEYKASLDTYSYYGVSERDFY